MSTKLIRIILVDDHKLVRESWKMLLENNPLFEVVADCDNGASAIELVEQLLPDVVLVDINMSPMNGFAVTEKLLEKMPLLKIVGLSVNNQSKYAIKMMELGARGYMTKTSPLEEINHCIEQVYAGEVYVCKEISPFMPSAG